MGKLTVEPVVGWTRVPTSPLMLYINENRGLSVAISVEQSLFTTEHKVILHPHIHVSITRKDKQPVSDEDVWIVEQEVLSGKQLLDCFVPSFIKAMAREKAAREGYPNAREIPSNYVRQMYHSLLD